MKQVVIVNAGGKDAPSLEKDPYTAFCQSLKEQFEGVCGSNKPDSVIIVGHEETAKPMNKGDLLVFVCRSKLADARAFKKGNPGVKVVVMVTLVPSVQVMVLGKSRVIIPLLEALVETPRKRRIR